MNRQHKPNTSAVVRRNLRYNTSGSNTELRELIRAEQKNFCAYTQARFTPTHSPELDHFNPTLKDTENDGYNNWYVINSRWNRVKGDRRRWNRFQPNLNPTDENFETRIYYENGYYKARPEDDDAQTLIDYLVLNQSELVRDRLELTERLRDMFRDFDKTPEEFKEYIREKFPYVIQYTRAIKTELEIDFLI